MNSLTYDSDELLTLVAHIIVEATKSIRIFTGNSYTIEEVTSAMGVAYSGNLWLYIALTWLVSAVILAIPGLVMISPILIAYIGLLYVQTQLKSFVGNLKVQATMYLGMVIAYIRYALK